MNDGRYETLGSSAAKYSCNAHVKAMWQAIILEHAESSIYREFLVSGDLNELPEWRNGEKLIPEDWL